MYALALGMLLLQSQGYDERDYVGRTDVPLMIGAGAAATNPDFIDRPVEVCGHIVLLDPERNEAMMVGRGKALMVDMRGRAELAVRRAACVTGVIRRRDGMTEREHRERGLPREYISHAATPDIVLYQCHDPVSCVRLMQPGPVRPEQLDVRERRR